MTTTPAMSARGPVGGPGPAEQATTAALEQLDRVTRRLLDDFADQVPEDLVRGEVARALGQLGTPRVTQFVPILVDRSVRDRLRERRG